MTPLAFVPAWREDETVFSWCCFYHAVAGNLSARQTGAMLFGVEHACRERWAPLHLRYFAERTDGALGSAASILTQRTPLALFWPFLGSAKRGRILDSLDKGTAVGWTTAIGMPAAALAATDLRCCQACVEEDLVEYRIPRWRLSHQLAGAWVCLDHGEPLSILRTRASAWILPGNGHGRTLPALKSSIDAQGIEQLKRVAIMARAVVAADAIDLAALRAAALAVLRARGITGWLHSIDPQYLGNWFRTTALAAALEYLPSAERRLKSGHWIHDLLRMRCAQHPLKWLLLWVALHEAACVDQLVRSFLDPESAEVAWDSRGQGSLWSSSASDALSTQLCAHLADAKNLKATAKSLGMSTCALRRRLQGAGLAASGVAASLQWECRRIYWVESVHRFVALNPGCTRTAVHKACKAAVTWLAREAPDDLWRELAVVPDMHGRQLHLDLQIDQRASSSCGLSMVSTPEVAKPDR